MKLSAHGSHVQLERWEYMENKNPKIETLNVLYRKLSAWDMHVQRERKEMGKYKLQDSKVP